MVQLLQDPSFKVREEAAVTVGKFSEHIVPEFLQQHATVLPALLSVLQELQNSSEIVLSKALYALHEFCENLTSDDIKPYLPAIVPLVLAYIKNGSRGVKNWALNALSTVCSAAEEYLQPYYEEILASVTQFTEKDYAKDHLLRGQALVAAGQIARSGGKAAFAPYIDLFSQTALQCLEDKAFEARESAFSFFANAAAILRDGIAPLIEKLVNTASEAILSKEGIHY